MTPTDAIIIGGGAAGLMAARDLCRAGLKVTVLEAQNRLGGRIHTVDAPGFSLPIEAGAEFIHGDLPLTLGLLEQYDIKYAPVGGEMWDVRSGKLQKGFNFVEGNDILEEELRKLPQDISVEEFLRTHFSDEKYTALRNSVTGFVKGFDAADPARASTFTLRDEWLEEVQHQQYRVKGGYEKMIDALVNECGQLDCIFELSNSAKEVQWTPGKATVICSDKRTFTGRKVIVTVPLGILLAGAEGEHAIRFSPGIAGKLMAATTLGFGDVIKVILQFSHPFWKDRSITTGMGADLSHLGFIFSDAYLPTWWTQNPDDSAVLTGWLGGPEASKFALAGEKAILFKAMDALAYIFNEPVENLESKLQASYVANWKMDPYTLGAYAYATVGAEEARTILSAPVDDTLFFAGEALFKGQETGTVEAALVSGAECARVVLGS